MSSIAWPAGLTASGFSLTLATVQRSYASPFSGSEQVIDLLQDRWTATVTLPPNVQTLGGAREGFVASLRNMTNTVNLWHMARPAPLGTMRGAPTLSGDHAQGAATLNIATAAGNTIKAGDMLGVNGLLLMAAADATSQVSSVAAPTLNAPSTATTGGTLAAATYYYKVTALGATGETTGSNEVSQATTGTTSTVSLSWAAVSGATGYKVYRGTAAGGESVYYSPGNVTSFTDTGAASTAGTVPGTNTANTNASLAVPLANRLRVLCSNGSVVTWDKPTAPFRMTTKAPGVNYAPGIANALTLDFLEAVS